MKRLPYKNKDTSANTQYRELSPLDRNWVLDHAQELIDLDNELRKYNSLDSKTLNSPNPKMPRKSGPFGNGRNSARSMCEGVISNITTSGQRDLTDKQMNGLQEAFRVANTIIPEFEEVDFVEVSPFDSLTKKVPVVDPKTVFESLFDIETITVTYKKK